VTIRMHESSGWLSVWSEKRVGRSKRFDMTRDSLLGRLIYSTLYIHSLSESKPNNESLSPRCALKRRTSLGPTWTPKNPNSRSERSPKSSSCYCWR
jgi:hypothetical protein